MKIPKQFDLLGVTWTVKEDPLLRSEFGYTNQAEASIVLNSQKTINKDMKEQTFWHEAVHAVLFAMGHTEHDEKFVDCFAGLLHQLHKTKQ